MEIRSVCISSYRYINKSWRDMRLQTYKDTNENERGDEP